MLQYAPSNFDWLLLVQSRPLALFLFLVGLAIICYGSILIVWPTLLRRNRHVFKQNEQQHKDGTPGEQTLRRARGPKPSKPSKLPLVVTVLGLLFSIGSLLLPQTAPYEKLTEEVAQELASTAHFKDVKLVHIATNSYSYLNTGAVSFLGTAVDVNDTPRQFRYTQYENFGVYEMIGFDKPAVELKDQSYKETEEGLNLLKETATPTPEKKN